MKLVKIKGADTETHKGYCRLLCIEEWFHLYEPEECNWQSFLEYLLNAPDRLCFWNLRFDIEAILKHFPEEFVKNLLYLSSSELIIGNRTYVFKLIPWKVFSIKEMAPDGGRRRTKRKVECFDAQQFYHDSLNNAAKDVLGEEKVEDREFAALLNTSLEPWNNELQRIIRYCYDDAVKAGRLMRQFQDSTAMDPIGLAPKNPISCAWYAKELIRQVIPETQSLKSITTNQGFYYTRPWHRWDNMGSQCYFGGRFEVFMKGLIEDCFVYDINSAYPYWIAQLPNPFNLKFVKDYEPEGDFSMVKAEVWVPEDLEIGPLPFRTDTTIIFPVGHWTGWFHWHELKNSEKYGVEYNVMKALNGYEPNGIQRPFAQRIPEFYTKRAEWKTIKDPRHLSAKIAMNSVYGVLYEKNERIVESNKSNATEIDGHLLRKSKDNPGKYCYPFLAGWITSKTRVQILNASIPGETGFAATDGILSRKKLNLPISKKLGEWGVDKIDEAHIFSNGVYMLDGKLKTRGFRKDAGRDERPLKDRMFERNGEIFIEVQEQGPIHINSAFRLRDYSMKDALIWIDKTKEMNLTRCEKRHWPQFTVDDLFTRTIPSTIRKVDPIMNRNPGIVWTGNTSEELNLMNRFKIGAINV